MDERKITLGSDETHMIDDPAPVQDGPDDDVCVHKIVPELVGNPSGGIGLMRLTIIGHKHGTPEADDEVATLIMNVPNAATFASRILDKSAETDDLTAMITAMALARETKITPEQEAEIAASRQEAMMVLRDLLDFQEPTEKPRGVRAVHPADEPVNLLYGMGNPDDRPTMAPLDNRDEYPGMGEGGYL